MIARAHRHPEVWAGAECSVVRIGEKYYDALERSGHARRVDDIERIASLGVTAVRFPLLWERTAPGSIANADWSWADERLEQLRAYGVRPIVGLVHHGSGPRYTNVLDADFAAGLADFARAVAERYPWIQDFTPVNEPLTTARFSALYGHWYPHARSPEAFFRALLNQCRAVKAAMEAIRERTPGARLVQTEDFARVASTPPLAYQATFENDRRWLSLDLLCGCVRPGHALYDHLREHGVTDDDLRPFAERPCVPDVIGLNYYVTSERWLDDRVERYPPSCVGGNGRDTYADVEAARASPDGIGGHDAAIAAAWDRYHRPLALTEVHLGCTREEQLRWWNEAWWAAVSARRRGIDLRAVTAWALFGSHDWDTLLLGEGGHYEPGAFDVRFSPPRPTALAAAVAACATSGVFEHPVLDTPGWWRRAARFGYGARAAPGLEAPSRAAGRPLLIAGAGGALAPACERVCAERGLSHVLASGAALDVLDESSVARSLDAHRPWAVVNASGHLHVDVLEAACAARRIPLAQSSSAHTDSMLHAALDRLIDGESVAVTPSLTEARWSRPRRSA